MKLTRIILALGLGMSGSAFAHCWDECVLPNPFGGCGKTVKMCDVGNPGRAAASLGNDIKDAENRIVANWHDVYGDNIPPELRSVLEEYPITIACAIVPETRGYVLAVAAIESLVAHSKQRDEQAKPFEQNAPDWKKTFIGLGKRKLIILDGIKVSSLDYNDPTLEKAQVLDKYQGVFGEYLNCLNVAQDQAAGNVCLDQLSKHAAIL